MRTQKQTIFILLVIALTIIFPSCGKKNRALEEALSFAGDNRPELEKVLDYYSMHKQDSLKLKAARFLIENMPGHCSYSGEQISAYYAAIDTILKSDRDPASKMQLVNQIAGIFPDAKKEIKEDIKIITAAYLIKNIDTAFDLWKNDKLTAYLSFNDFCEYLLPYKCAELQPLDYWRDTLSSKFNKRILNDAINDENYHSPYYRAYWVNAEIREDVKPIILPELNEFKGGKFYSSASMYRMPFGDCFDYSVLAVSVLRSHGIPAALDYIPQWGRGYLRHSWFSFVNDNGMFMSSPWGVDSNPGDIFHPWAILSKIFRYSYAPDERRKRYHEEVKYRIANHFSIFNHDVTGEYLATSNLSIPVQTDQLKDKYVYIAVFNGREWNVVDFGPVKNKKAWFGQMGRGTVYLVLGHDGNGLIPVSDPFILHKNGSLHYCRADRSDVGQVTLTRKYPVSAFVALVESRLVGGKIQASHRKDFSECETFYAIDSVLFPDLVSLNCDTPYRYWRYLSPDGSGGNISEVQFYEKGKDGIAKGRVIGSEGSPGWSKENVFDENWLTSFDSVEPDGNWMGLEFDEPVCIDRVRCAPRTDDNLIHSGDEYELKYWDAGQWVSLGARVATEKVLKYDGVPRNALLWLSNITHGRQECLFTYEEGRQVWW